MRRAGVPEQLQEDVPPGAVLVFAEVVEQAVGFVGSELRVARLLLACGGWRVDFLAETALDGFDAL